MNNHTRNASAGPIAPMYVIYAWFCTTMFISFFGTCVSVLLLIVIYQSSTKKVRSNILICLMLFINLLMIAVFTPMDNIITFRTQLGYRDTVHCSVLNFFRQTNLGATYWSACAVAINRLIASCFPHRYKDIFSFKKMVMYVVICLSVPALLNIFTASGVSGRAFQTFPLGVCGSIPTNLKSFAFINAVAHAFPLAVQGVAHVLLALRLFKKGHGNADQPEASAKRRRQITLAKILIVSYFWYLLCFLPMPMAKPLLITKGFWVGHEMTLLTLKAVELCGSVGTPVIFFMLGTDYQTKLKSMLTGHRISQAKSTH